MALTKRQIEEIKKVIELRTNKFVLRSVGEKALSTDQLNELKRYGVIRTSVRNMTMDAYTMGKIVSLIHPREETKGLSFNDLKHLIEQNKISLTPVEKEAINIAQEQAGIYIQGLSDRMVRDLKVTALTGREQALNAIQNKISEGIAKRQTLSEIKTALFHQLDDRSRDWRRIAHTEINNSIQKAIYNRIQTETTDPDQQVFKRPNPDACKYCKKVYLESDGVTPKLFKLTQLEETNVGRKAQDWQATINGVHPWCRCQLQVMPKGWGFEERKTVGEEFEFEGEKYGKGREVPESIYSSLDEETKDKITTRAIMTYKRTGTEL